VNLFSFIDFICIDTPFLSICSFNSNQFVSSLKGLLHASLSRFGTQEESEDGLVHRPYDGDDPKDGDTSHNARSRTAGSPRGPSFLLLLQTLRSLRMRRSRTTLMRRIGGVMVVVVTVLMMMMGMMMVMIRMTMRVTVMMMMMGCTPSI